MLLLVLLQVSGHVEDAVAKGATVTIGGKIPDLPEPYNKVSLCPGSPGASSLQPQSPFEAQRRHVVPSLLKAQLLMSMYMQSHVTLSTPCSAWGSCNSLFT